MFGLLLCLDETDAEKLTTQGLLGSRIPDISFAQLQCVLEYAEVTEFIDFLNSNTNIENTPNELQSALVKCEINSMKT